MLPPPFIIIYYLRSTDYLYLSLKLLVLLDHGKSGKGSESHSNNTNHGGHPLVEEL